LHGTFLSGLLSRRENLHEIRRGWPAFA
jgi:hypothetical protein